MESLKNFLFCGDKEKHWLSQQTGIAEKFFCLGDNGTILWEKGTSGGLFVLFRLQPAGGMLTNPKEDRYDVLPFEGCKVKDLADVFCTDDEAEIGILREIDDKLSFCAFEKKEPGTIVYPKTTLLHEKDMMYGTNISSLLLFSLAAACIAKANAASDPVAVALVNESANGVEDSLGLIAKRKPERLLVCSVCCSNDTIAVGKGVGIGIKDGDCFLDKNEYEKVFSLGTENNILTQPFVNHEKSSLVRLFLTAKIRSMASIYLPVTGLHGKIEEISALDVEKTQNLVLKYIETFAII